MISFPGNFTISLCKQVKQNFQTRTIYSLYYVTAYKIRICAANYRNENGSHNFLPCYTRLGFTYLDEERKSP
jgi:hypothetical protein